MFRDVSEAPQQVGHYFGSQTRKLILIYDLCDTQSLRLSVRCDEDKWKELQNICISSNVDASHRTANKKYLIKLQRKYLIKLQRKYLIKLQRKYLIELQRKYLIELQRKYLNSAVSVESFTAGLSAGISRGQGTLV
jgi:hypothetical protein